MAERGQADADDIARVEAVRDALGPGGKVRIDVNGHWDVAHAARMLSELSKFGLEYAEQPCATLAEMAELRRLTEVPLAADESIRRAEDPLRVRAAGAADIVLIAGKGHEDYQIYGATRRSFSDRSEAQRVLGVAA